MNKVTALLLSMKFPELNINSLMEVINATPNPVIATEILCGIYEEPVFVNHQEKQDKNYGVLTFKSFNKWSQQVSYSYVRNVTKSGYFAKDTKKSDITMDNFDSLVVSSTIEGRQYFEIPTGITEERSSQIDLQDWMSKEAASYALQA